MKPSSILFLMISLCLTSFRAHSASPSQEGAEIPIDVDIERVVSGFNPPEGADFRQESGQEELDLIDDSEPENDEFFSLKEPKPSEEKEPYTDFIMARFTGAIFGFGIGHAIQGRWFDYGWVYAITDFLTLPIITWQWPLYGREDNFKYGASMFLLARSIEIYDVWTFRGHTTSDGQLTLGVTTFPQLNKVHHGLQLTMTF